ncbi:hypothetical protein Tco_0897500 [Tanacetum coccineum]
MSTPVFAYLDGTNTEFEPFDEPIDTETPELTLTIAPPISLFESTSPVLVPILRRTTCMAVRVPPAMSSGLSASIAEVAAMSESAFRKRFSSSYESLPFVSPPGLPSRNRYRGTSELVEGSEEDEEIEESLDSDSVDEDAEEKGSTTEDEDPAARDEGLAAEVEGLGTDDESHGLDDEIYGLGGEGHSIESDGLSLEEEEEEAVTRGQQQAALVMGTTVSAPLELGYRVLRCQELALEDDDVYNPEDGMVYIDVLTYPPPAPPVQTPPSPEWTSGSLPISPLPFVVPLPISSPMVPLTAASPVASPATAKTERFLTELGAKVEMQGGLICDHAVRSDGSHRSSSWACFSGYAGVETEIAVDSLLRRTYREKFFFRFAKVVDSMRRGQEPQRGT